MHHYDGNAPRLIDGQHLSDVSLLLCLSCVDVRKGLAVGIKHLEAAWCPLDLPGRKPSCRQKNAPARGAAPGLSVLETELPKLATMTR